MVDVILTNYNEQIDKINLSLQSICNQGSICKRIFVVDDGSKIIPLHQSTIYADTRITLLCMNENRGISYCRNRALEQVQSQYVVCMNMEIDLHPGWIDRCLAVLQQKKRWVLFLVN